MCDTGSNVPNAKGDSSGMEMKNEPTIAQQPEMLTSADMGGCLGRANAWANVFERQDETKAQKRS